MNSTLAEVVKRQREKTPFSKRYIEFLQAVLPRAVQDSVLFNIVDWQWKNGELRTDRQYVHYVKGAKMSQRSFDANEASIIENKSDAKVVGYDDSPQVYANERGEEVATTLGAFKKENSLDMCETGEAWLVYVTEGGEMPVTI